MSESGATSQLDRADRWSRRDLVSGITGLGAALISRRSGASEISGDRSCSVLIDTSYGSIGIRLDLGRAPISAGDFLKYVDQGLYTGGSFYRTVRPDNDPEPTKIAVVQGGLTDEKRFLAPIAHEPTNRTGLRHRNGTISIGRGEVGTGTAGAFFICIGDQPELDFGGKRNSDHQGFAAFGHVSSGMELIRKMWSLKVLGAPGTPDGESIASPVAILGARRLGSRCGIV